MSASTTNPTHITQGFQVLLQAISFTVASELRSILGLDWWKTAVLAKLYDDQKQKTTCLFTGHLSLPTFA